MDQSTARTSPRIGRRAFQVAVVLLAAAVAWSMVRVAWISDDAYITLRVVENVVAGDGPVWNSGERVQVYSHPLWMLLLLLARLLVGAHYPATIALSLLLTALAVVVVLRAARALPAALAVLACLLASRAFGDFATSGLETPLTMLLLALLCRRAVAPHGDEPADASRPDGVFGTALLVGLLASTRLDTLALAGPLLAVSFWQARSWRAARHVLAGLAPLLLWELFSVTYYASAVPITAYAKAIAPGVPFAELAEQGLRYLAHCATRDPITLLLAVGAPLVALGRGGAQRRMLALGALCYCGYVVRVGGDFMAGRFLVPPMLVGVALLGAMLGEARSPRVAIGLAAAALALAFVPGLPPWLVPPSTPFARDPQPNAHGINDERSYYYADNGMLSPGLVVPEPGETSRRLRAEGRTRPLVMMTERAGKEPFRHGALFYFVDRFLCDPLLARLPIRAPGDWRVGHFPRALPVGYLESLAHGDDRLQDERLASFYRTLRAALRAPLWSQERLSAATTLLLGGRADELRQYVDEAYRTPTRRALRADQLVPAPWPEQLFWFDDARVAALTRAGVVCDLGAPRTARTVRLYLSPLANYTLRFTRGGAVVATRELLAWRPLSPANADIGALARLDEAGGMHPFELELGEELTFDGIELDGKPLSGLVIAAFGGVAFGP